MEVLQEIALFAASTGRGGHCTVFWNLDALHWQLRGQAAGARLGLRALRGSFTSFTPLSPTPRPLHRSLSHELP
jgi:hypothetical protein